MELEDQVLITVPAHDQSQPVPDSSPKTIVVHVQDDETLKGRIEAQTDAAVQAAAKEVVRPDALTWVVVGDLSKIEKPVRDLGIGEVKVMDADGKAVR